MDEKLIPASEENTEEIKDEIELEIKDHRADEEFERMLAELNGETYVPKNKPGEESAEKAEAASETEESTPVAPAPGRKKQGSNEPVFNGVKREAVKPKRPDEEALKNFERDQKEREEAEKRRRMQQVEREREQNKNKMIDQIANLWNMPELNDGGRVKLNIKTEDRKEIHIVIPKDKQTQQTQQSKQTRQPQKKPVPPAVEAKTIEMQKLSPEQRSAISEKAKRFVSETAAEGQRKAAAPKRPAQSAGQPRKTAQTGAKGQPQGAAKRAVPASAAVIEGPMRSKPKTKAAPPKAAEPNATALSADDIRRKQISIVNVLVCCSIFFGLGLFLLFCNRQSGFISSENRNLAEKPKLTLSSVLNGSYFTDITKWYTDTIPGREELKPVSSKFSNLFGVHVDDVKINNGGLAPVKKETLDPEKAVTTTEVTINTDFTKKSTDVTTTKKKKSTTTEKLAEVPKNLDDGEWIGSVIVSGKGENVRAMSAFNGTFAAGEFYAQTINKYKAELGSSVNVYTMNMPSAGAYYMPENLADQFTSQHDCILNIGNNLEGIVNVDVYNALATHCKEYIYSRTDHHWQPLGAYYAAQVFAEKARFDFPEITTYEKASIENFVGTMYAYSNYDEELNNNPDTFIYYKPDNLDQLDVYNYDEYFGSKVGAMLFHEYASGVNCYSCIMGTDDIICEIDTPVHNGRTLVMIKDSFGNALVPYLTHGFEKIYVVDFRYFQLNAIDFIEQVGCTDLLFAVSIGAAHTESHVNMIGNIRIQNAGQTIDVGEPDVVIPDQQETTTTAAEPEQPAETEPEYTDYNYDNGYDNGYDGGGDYNNW